jgi:hypothetical protein
MIRIIELLALLARGAAVHAAIWKAGRAIEPILTGLALGTAARVIQLAGEAAAATVAGQSFLAGPLLGDEQSITWLAQAAYPRGNASADDRAGGSRGDRAADEARKAMRVLLAFGGEALEAACLPVGDTARLRRAVTVTPAATARHGAAALEGASHPSGRKSVRR